MNNKGYNKWYLVIVVFAVIFTFFGGSLAYWQWTTNTSERTNIALTVKEDFRCDADGGGDISNDEKYLVPTDCTNSEYAIQRTVTVKPTLFTNQLGVDLDLWLTINNIGTGLRNSNNFKYVLTTNSNSCTEGIVSSGTFKSKSNGSKVTLLDSKIYLESTTDTYYLYVWLDSAETSTSTMDQEFSLSLGGECISTTEGIINGVGTGGYAEPILNGADPVLDDGMVPILLSDTGVATVADIDSKWYNYENKEWANMVLVKENATSGVTGSYSREYYLNNPGTTVLESDILAYYVWIPRYKYKVKNSAKCSKLSEYYLNSSLIDNYGMFNYPECYAPYTMTETDKSVISEALYMVYLEETGDEEFSLEHSVSDLNDGLITGKVNLMGTLEVSLVELVYLLNSQMELNLTLNGTFNEENLTSNLGSIDISFQSLLAPISTGDAIDTYKTHPAFTFGNEGLNGIWVGKFETSTDTSSACYTSTSSSNCNNTNQEPRILPNVMSLRYQNVSNQFQTSLKFAGGTMNASTGVVTFAGSNTYGLTNQTDSHMMKNSE